MFSAKLSPFQNISLDILIAKEKCSKYNIQKFIMLFLQQGKLHVHKNAYFRCQQKSNCEDGSVTQKRRGGIKVSSFKSLQLSHQLSGTKCRSDLNISLCISQFQLRPALPPPRGFCRAFARLVSPGGEAFDLQILCCPGARHLPTLGPFPSF